MIKKLHFKKLLLMALMLVGAGSAWADDVIIWSEDFTGFVAEATPTTPSNTAYTGVTYTCADGTGTSPGSTKIQNEKLAGGAAAPELMVGKKGSGTDATGGKFTAVIPLDNFEGTLTLTYYQNKQTLKVSSTTEGVSGGQTYKPSDVGKQTTTFTGITSSMTSITIVFEATTTNNVRLDDIVLKGSKASAVAAPSFSPVAGTYTEAQSVAISTTTAGATIYYTTNGTVPTTSSTAYSTPISVSSSLTIKAIAVKGSDVSSVATATYTILPIEHAGTAADPYTVADARNAIDANTGVTAVYGTGIVSKIVTAYSSENKNISFDISADGTTTADQLRAYRCKGTNDADASKIKVGDIVVIKGNLTKYGEIYEFAEANELISLTHSVTPTITVNSTSLTGFTYVGGNGPSVAKSISVTGSNLTTNISLSVSNNYEISLSEGSGYASTLTLTQTEGSVASTKVYVRLKAGLEIAENYEGTITLTSTGATNQTVSLAGSVTVPCITWDLSQDQTASASATELTWTSSYASMAATKGNATTATNNYYPGTTGKTYTSTRFYGGSNLAITPAVGYAITSVVFTATSENYATALKNSTWRNASANVSGKTVTITPTTGAAAISATIGATCGFTSVIVYYEQPTSVNVTIPAAGYTTIAATVNLNFTGVTAYAVSGIGEDDVTLTPVTQAPANTPLVLKGSAGSHNLTVVASAAAVSPNYLKVSDGTMTSDDDYNVYALANGADGVGFYLVKAGVYVPAGKCYFKLGKAEIATRDFFGFGDETTGIANVNGNVNDNQEVYDLQGRRVDQPTKGLYIVNGKKIFVK